MTRVLALCLLSSLLVASGCATAPPGPLSPHLVSPPGAEADFVFVTLVTGPRSAEKTPAERQEIFNGHMANIQRLAAERKLLVAGPYGDEKHDASLRGIFVFDVPTVEAARELTGTDPGVQSGMFALQCQPLRASVALRRIYDLDREDKEALAREGKAAGMGESIRGYVLLTARDAERADAALAGLAAQGKVIWSGHLGGEQADEAVYVLDAEDAAGAKQMLGPALERAGECWLDSWWSTRSLVRLQSSSECG